MEPEDLPDAEDLWWSWVVLAALHRAVGNDACRFHAKQLLLTLDSADGWLRMQRTHGSRSVLWGRSALAPDSPPDARRGAPDWALSDATEERRPTFFAWHAHDEWDSSALGVDEGAVHLLRPLLTVDPRIVALGREGRLTPDELAAYAHGEHLEEAAEIARLAAATAPRTSRGSVWSRLRDQIHDQMRDTLDIDRELMQRPPILVQWSRASGPGVPFEYDVMAVRGTVIPSPLNTRLPTPVVRSLTNVLRTLHREEASEESGAWLFARVTSDGVVIRFERAFDSWPSWYQVRHSNQGPALEDLAWEMAQRTPPWRPPWASLLPPG
ncbi:hypothetical protein [Marmoricola sp. URHB0036]|uniref:hypothetical protein n=1 Tax=Marmoricola sp. URHB0036 TaxID=1298863 RepID=UPI000414F71C|nr:hypothetical protein [Marmoricola sp. URHB0036]